MDLRERILKEFSELLEESAKIVRAGGWDGRIRWGSHPSRDDYVRIRTRSLNLVEKSCGKKSSHYEALLGIASQDPLGHHSYNLPQCAGMLQAARDDFERGLLLDLRALVEAEVLGDILEQAEALLSHGYYKPAASLAGAILEDALRKLCDQKGVARPASTKIDSLNSELAKAGVYERGVQKRITALADIRNNADHGQFDKFKVEDVEDMLKWLVRFLADYLN
jgi:hypothetical protein